MISIENNIPSESATLFVTGVAGFKWIEELTGKKAVINQPALLDIP